MTAAEILVTILSVTLAVFLVLAIVLVILLIVIAQKIKRVATAAEHTVSNVGQVVSTLQKAAAPAVISRFILEQISRFADKAKKNKEDR